MTRRDLAWKWTAYGVVLLLVYLLNYHVLAYLPLGAAPLLPLAAAVAVGVLEGPASGAGYGAAAGLLMAAATHGSAGWVSACALAGWVCGLVTQYVLRRDLVGFTLSCLASCAAAEVFRVLCRLLPGKAGLEDLLRVAAPEFFWTALFSFPIYAMCRFCCKRYGRIYHE